MANCATCGKILPAGFCPTCGRSTDEVAASNGLRVDGSLVEYWKKVRDTIQGFDDFLLKHNERNMALLSATLVAGSIFYLQGNARIAAFLTGGVTIVALLSLYESHAFRALLKASVETGTFVEETMISTVPGAAKTITDRPAELEKAAKALKKLTTPNEAMVTKVQAVATQLETAATRIRSEQETAGDVAKLTKHMSSEAVRQKLRWRFRAGYFGIILISLLLTAAYAKVGFFPGIWW